MNNNTNPTQFRLNLRCQGAETIHAHLRCSTRHGLSKWYPATTAAEAFTAARIAGCQPLSVNSTR